MKIKLLTGANTSGVSKRLKIVAAAGKLSRFPGKVTEVYNSCNDDAKNQRFIERVIEMGHESITDHDYLVFAIEDVSPIIEQILIEERIASFTIKSRREVDFSRAGYYTPNFRDRDYNILPNNNQLKKKYHEHMKYLFTSYSELLEMGAKKEDARFVLPYSFHSNIEMGCDAHVAKNLIVRFLTGKESKIAECREFGEKLYQIFKEYVPYYQKTIDKAIVPQKDEVKELLDNYLGSRIPDWNMDELDSYDILKGVSLIGSTCGADDGIIKNALMRVYGYDKNKALAFYNCYIKTNLPLKRELMLKILKNGGAEFKQVNFKFQVPVSLAVLTHLTRHRTHHLMVPDFVPIRDLNQYVVPPTFNEGQRQRYDEIYKRNHDVYTQFRKFGICDEDLIYFYLAGTKMNVITNMDGQTLLHISRLRICNKAQWEIRNIVTEMRSLVLEQAPIYGSILGPDCEIFLECHEGKESCGKVNVLRDRANAKR